MAVLKRGLLIGGAALAGILALAGLASASTRPTGGGTDPEDPYSPEACEAYRQEREGVLASRNQLQAQLNSVRNQMAAAVAAGEEEQAIQLAVVEQNLEGALFQANRRVQDLDDLIAGCN